MTIPFASDFKKGKDILGVYWTDGKITVRYFKELQMWVKTEKQNANT